MSAEHYDIAIIGAGPTGLAAGLRAQEHALRHIVLDKGTLVNTIVGYPTGMTFFSTPERLELGAMPFTSPNFRPSRIEAIEYYRGVARKGEINLQLHTRVVAVHPTEDGFTVETNRDTYHAHTVILATGYFDTTNNLNIPGEDLPKVHHYYKEPFPFYGQEVLVIGGRNSAVETALDLYRHGAHVTMIHRGDALGKGVKYWIRPDIENRINSGEIRMYWNTEVQQIGEQAVTLQNNKTGEQATIGNDAVFAMIGYRPDTNLLEACGVRYHPETLIPDYAPETYETNIPGLFLAGSIACGCQAWEIFIENGREHAVSVVDTIARRLEKRAG